MLRLRLSVVVMGNDGIAWSDTSNIIEGKDAEETRKMVNDFSDLKMFSYPSDGRMVFMNKHVLDRAIILVEELDEATD